MGALLRSGFTTATRKARCLAHRGWGGVGRGVKGGTVPSRLCFSSEFPVLMSHVCSSLELKSLEIQVLFSRFP